ncbi:MAG: hypothetical protein M3510_12315 [Actinomycetota bacterium]|nr:hypothetical protein [Actinomycetota bacterium]
MPLDEPLPDEVLALRFDEAAVAEDLAAWCDGRVEHYDSPGEGPSVVLWVPTATGIQQAVLGDWVVRRDKEAFEVHSTESFSIHFEPSDPEAEQ